MTCCTPLARENFDVLMIFTMLGHGYWWLWQKVLASRIHSRRAREVTVETPGFE